jgi:hypothetical protein
MGTYVPIRRRPQADFELAMRLMRKGFGDTQIARRTGIPRPTIAAWRHNRGRRYHDRLATANPAWRPPRAPEYCYLLGVYLGDGCLHTSRGGASSLVVSLDSSYPAIVNAVDTSIRDVFAGVPVARVFPKDANLVVLRASHPALPFAFPQHGSGRKHKREIRLTEWQRELTHAHPEQLLRGLIHSDGCRTINRFKTKLPSGRVAEYEYPRYFFSNLSADIRAIFCAHCELLGVRWTQSNLRNISVSHRRSVALLDEFVGPKR